MTTHDTALTQTSIHRALGESSPLDFDMVVRAVAEGVAEDESLDWKGGEYRAAEGGDRDPADEFAKDIVAFANSRGGLLLLGVSEDRRTGRAQRATPFTITDALVRKMTSWLYPRVAPTLPGIRFVPLLQSGSADQGFLAIAVPPSPDMPHMIGSKKACGFPYRDGTQTNWMREFDLERSYRDRFERRENDEVALDRLISDAALHLDGGVGRWLVAAARPTIPLGALVEPPDQETVRTVMEWVEREHASLVPEGQNRAPKVISSFDSHVLNPRVGLRRWVMSATEKVNDPSALAESVHIELHHDGSVVLAVSTNPWGEGGVDDKDVLSDAALSALAVCFTNLVGRYYKVLGVTGDALARIDLRGEGGQRSCGFVMPQRSGPVRFAAEQQPWTRDVRQFHAVDLVVPPAGEDVAARQEIVRLIIRDVAAQFGVRAADIGW